MLAVQPKPDGLNSSIVTLSASPGSAPSTKTGPVTGLTLAKSSAATSATVLFGRKLAAGRVEALELERRPRRDRSTAGGIE